MLFHCIPKLQHKDSPFDFTMRSVLVAQKALISALNKKSLSSFSSVMQNKENQIRYSKNKDFTDEIAKEFLDRNLQLNADSFSYPELLNPIFG